MSLYLLTTCNLYSQVLSSWHCSFLKITRISHQLCGLSPECFIQTVSCHYYWHYIYSVKGWSLGNMCDFYNSVLAEWRKGHIKEPLYIDKWQFPDPRLGRHLHNDMNLLVLSYTFTAHIYDVMGCFFIVINDTNLLVLTFVFLFFVFRWPVYADGSICLDILQNQWSPIYDVAAILTSIQVS